MKKCLLLLLCLLLALAPVFSLADNTITCYTGPGHNYATLDFSLGDGVSITCYYIAYDSTGAAWVQVEVNQGSDLLRVYIPRENITGDVSTLTVEKRAEELIPSMLAWVYETSPTAVPRLGPGTQYNKLAYTLTSQTEGVIILFENGWGLLEIEQEDCVIRMWLPEGDLQY